MRTPKSSTSTANRVSSSRSAPALTTASARPSPRLGLSVAFETLGGRFPDLELVGSDGNVEWDYEGFAGVVGLDCFVPHAGSR